MVPKTTESDSLDDFIVDDNAEVEVESGRADTELDQAASEINHSLVSKPIYVLAKWKHPVTRDGRIAVVILLPAGVLEQDDGVCTTIVDGTTVRVTFMWPRVLLDSNKLTGAILSFCSDMDISHGTLLAQGLMDFLEMFQERQGDSIASTCTITLPFKVKPDFSEDVLSFENSDVRLYLLRLSAPERNFVALTRRISVHEIRNTDTNAPRTLTTLPTSQCNVSAMNS